LDVCPNCHAYLDRQDRLLNACPQCEEKYSEVDDRIVDWTRIELEVECDDCEATITMGVSFCSHCGVVYNRDHWDQVASEYGIDKSWAIRVANSVPDDHDDDRYPLGVHWDDIEEDTNDPINLCCNKIWSECDCGINTVTPDEFIAADYQTINSYYDENGGCDRCMFYGTLSCTPLKTKFVASVQEDESYHLESDLKKCASFSSAYSEETSVYLA
jgi:hypothetical protein